MAINSLSRSTFTNPLSRTSNTETVAPAPSAESTQGVQPQNDLRKMFMGDSFEAYGIKKSTTSNVQDSSVVDFYRQKVGAGDGYVIPADDARTLGTNDNHLSVHLSND